MHSKLWSNQTGFSELNALILLKQFQTLSPLNVKILSIDMRSNKIV